MTKLDLYTGKTVFVTTLLASSGLVALLTVFTFLDQLGDIENEYTLLTAAKYVGYSIPRIFYETLPYATLLGCLSGLGILASSSELIVMRSAGVSPWEITSSAAKPAIVIVILGLIIGEILLPQFERNARIIKENAIEDDITPSYGFWHKENDTYVHLGRVTSSGVLKNISLFVEKNGELVRTIWAERATFDNSQTEWTMRNVKVTHIGERTLVEFQESMEWDIGLTPSRLNTEILVDPDRMSIIELLDKITYMKEQELNSARFEIGLWTKIFQPLASLALVLVGVSFIFGPLRETNMGTRLVSGIVFGIVFKFLQDMFAPASIVFGFYPIIGAITPVLGCILLGWYLLKKAG